MCRWWALVPAVAVIDLSDAGGAVGVCVHLRGVPPLNDHLDDRSDIRESVCGSEGVHESEDEGTYILGRLEAHSRKNLWHDVDHQDRVASSWRIKVYPTPSRG
jgi:hypothetical protein